MRGKLIQIGRELVMKGSGCHYNDFTRAFYYKYPNLRESVSVETITRALRDLRKRGVFESEDPGTFFVIENFNQRIYGVDIYG